MQFFTVHCVDLTDYTLIYIFIDRGIGQDPPSIIHKGIPSTVENLLDGKQGIYITSKELRASDPDSPDDTLQFTITRPPHFGYLENVLTGRCMGH